MLHTAVARAAQHFLAKAVQFVPFKVPRSLKWAELLFADKKMEHGASLHYSSYGAEPVGKSSC